MSPGAPKHGTVVRENGPDGLSGKRTLPEFGVCDNGNSDRPGGSPAEGRGMLSVSERVVRYLPKTPAAVSGWWPRFGGSN